MNSYRKTQSPLGIDFAICSFHELHPCSELNVRSEAVFDWHPGVKTLGQVVQSPPAKLRVATRASLRDKNPALKMRRALLNVLALRAPCSDLGIDLTSKEKKRPQAPFSS
jgi:hypothetical protein